MKIHLIWAQDQNGGIGRDSKLPWHISEDLKNFKQLTLNATIVMGRKTWMSLPVKPLPGRRNVVLSSNAIAEVESYNSIEQCIETLCTNDVKKIFVIGGAQIYHHFIHRADELHITLIDTEAEGIDTYFPVSLLTISSEFNKVDEYALGKNALYTHWVKNKLLDSDLP